MNMEEPWFSDVCDGSKKVEGRLNRNEWKDLNVGDILEFVNNESYNGMRKVRVRITKRMEYQSFKCMLVLQGVQKCLPTILSVDGGVAIYRKYYSEEEEKECGVVALHIEVVK